MQPFMTGNSSSNLASVSGQVSRDNHVARDNVFDWNLDNFQIDLTHGLGSAESYLSGVNRSSTSDPWSSFLPNRTTESVNLSRNSLAESSGAAALNNQVWAHFCFIVLIRNNIFRRANKFRKFTGGGGAGGGAKTSESTKK